MTPIFDTEEEDEGTAQCNMRWPVALRDEVDQVVERETKKAPHRKGLRGSRGLTRTSITIELLHYALKAYWQKEGVRPKAK